MLNNLASNEEEEEETSSMRATPLDIFGKYAKEAGTAAKELKGNAHQHMTNLAKEDRYRPILQQASYFTFLN
jgi:hypothetical protein